MELSSERYHFGARYCHELCECPPTVRIRKRNILSHIFEYGYALFCVKEAMRTVFLYIINAVEFGWNHAVSVPKQILNLLRDFLFFGG